MIVEKDILVKDIWQILEEVPDPEIPVLSIVDLGIVRDVLIFPLFSASPVAPGTQIEVIITPTYSGCPAMDVISISIKMALLKNGFKNTKISQQLSPAWTTGWMTDAGKDKLKSYGIAPPVNLPGSTGAREFPTDRLKKLFADDGIKIECPRCHSKNTTMLSRFGSTACKALYQCDDCREPFDYFKCH